MQEALLKSLAIDGAPSISMAVSAWVPAVKPGEETARANACRQGPSTAPPVNFSLYDAYYCCIYVSSVTF